MKKIIGTKVVYDKQFHTVDRCKKKPCNVRTTIIQTVKVYKYFWMSCPKRDITFTINQNDPGSKTFSWAFTDYDGSINNVANEEMIIAENWLKDNYRMLITDEITSQGFDFDYEVSFKSKTKNVINNIKKILKIK
jgi:hypothetical protein